MCKYYNCYLYSSKLSVLINWAASIKGALQIINISILPEHYVMQVLWIRLYSTSSSMDRGTLYQLRNLIDRRNVTTTPKNNVNACEDFLELVISGHAIAAAMKVLDMTALGDTPSSPLVSLIPWMYEEEERKSMLLDVASKVVDAHVDMAFDHSREKQPDCVYAYASEVLSLGLLYVEFHDAIKEGDGERVMRVWKYLLLLFRACHRTNYACEAFSLLSQYHVTLPPHLAEQLKWSRFINMHGLAGHNISCDLHMEHLNRLAKTAIQGLGANKSRKAILRVGKGICSLEKVLVNFDKVNNVAQVSGHRSRVSMAKDFRLIIDQLVSSDVFGVSEVDPIARNHAAFPDFSRNLMRDLDEKELKQWMLDRFSLI